MDKSRTSLLGKNYLEETDSLGGAIARKILLDGQRQFELKTDEGKFSVYADELEGGWYSVSLINYNVWKRSLDRIMVVYALIMILVVSFLVFVFMRLNAKNLALQKLLTRIDQEEKRGKEFKKMSETDRMTGLLDHVSGKRKVDELYAFADKAMYTSKKSAGNCLTFST